jgi:hypothetical protein
MDEDLKIYLGAMKRELREHTDAVETRLLLEFCKWAPQADARYCQHHSTVTGLDERVMLVEDRITAGSHRAIRGIGRGDAAD